MKQKDEAEISGAALSAGEKRDGSEVVERRALDEELRAQEKRFDVFFNTTQAGLAVIDNSLRYVRVNDTLARFNGLPAREHIGKTIREVAPAAARKYEPLMSKVLETGEPVLNLEVAGAADESGRRQQWLISFVPMPASDDAPPTIAALVLDITGRMQAEAALDEAENRYRMLIEHSSDVVLVFDEEGNFLEVNPRIFDLLGYTREEFLHLNVRDLIPAEDLAHHPINYDDLRAGKIIRRERRLRCKDGILVRVEVIGSMIGEGRMQSIVRSLERVSASTALESQITRALSTTTATDDGQSGLGLRLLKDMSAALSTAVELLEHAQRADAPPDLDVARGIDFYQEVSGFEINLIKRALGQTSGNQRKAADLLGIKLSTLNAMIKRYGIDMSEFLNNLI